jgi:phosphatidate cytidylyltransferase
MLVQRVITAIVLLALFLPTLSIGSPWPFILLTLVLISVGGWEWSRLNGAPGGLALLGAALVATGCGLVMVLGWRVGESPQLWWVAALLWTAGGAFALHAGPAGWPALPWVLRWVLGLVLLFLAWNAMAHARIVGVNFLLSVLCIVWTADIAAYFGGRALGRRKLAPTISPGKSWEGAAFGMLGALVLAALWLSIEQGAAVDSPSLFKVLHQRFGAAGLMLGVAALVAMSVVGDLFESMVKRAAGAKDSSQLLPGHGGVLDRIDALLPVLPCALALASL